MNKVEIIITNNRIPELKAKFPNLVQEIIDKTALDVQRFAIELMQMPKSGRTYKRGSKSHQASAPGEAPAIDTGNLVNSIEVKHPKKLLATVGPSDVEYAAVLEFGSEDGKIAARPFMSPAAEKARPKFIQALMQLESRLR